MTRYLVISFHTRMLKHREAMSLTKLAQLLGGAKVWLGNHCALLFYSTYFVTLAYFDVSVNF